MRKSIACLAVVWFVSAVSCWQYDNVVDPVAANYQGFETVTDPADTRPAKPDEGIVTYIPALVSTEVLGASAYQFQIAATADFAAPLYTSPESTSNRFFVSAL